MKMFRSHVRHLSFKTVAAGNEVIGLLGVKEDRNGSFALGPAKAPKIIRDFFFSPANNTYSELGVDVAPFVLNFGDVRPNSSNHECVHDSIQPIISDIFKRKLIPLTLGGDHSISFPVLKAIRELVNKPVTIVHFDAHPDVYPLFDNNPSSHASPFARICEETELCEKLISIGIRTATKEQQEQIEKYDIAVVEARNFPAKGSDIASYLSTFISEDTPVYISFDMDAIDPGLAPGVSHREPGGLSTRQAIDALHAIPGRIIGADVVEYNPEKDIDHITASVAAKIMKEIASKIILQSMSK